MKEVKKKAYVERKHASFPALRFGNKQQTKERLWTISAFLQKRQDFFSTF